MEPDPFVVIDKAQVCNRCRKVVCYKIKQAGTTIKCPFCLEPVKLPVNKDFQPHAPVMKKGRMLGLAVCLLIITATGFVFRQDVSTCAGVLTSWEVQDPSTAKAKGVRAVVTVKEIQYTCPLIHYAGLNRDLRTEQPLICLALEIHNYGKKPIVFHSWRLPGTSEVTENAELTNLDGERYGLTSFGADACPKEALKRESIEPGETVIDWVYFHGKKPDKDLKLVLPCGNVGGKGNMPLTVPVSKLNPSVLLH